MKNPFLILLLVIIGGGLALLLFNGSQGQTMGMDNDDFARLVALLPLALLFGSSIIIGSRYRTVEVVRNIAIWMAILLGLIVLWLYKSDFTMLGDRVLSSLVPGRAAVTQASNGKTEVTLYKGANGHFGARVEVNGTTIPMMVDTGASSMVLSFEDARKLGLDPDRLAFSATVMTANGRALAAPVTLQDVAIGPIHRQRIPALVTPQGSLDESLLGMSFLSTLTSLQMQSEELRLID